MKRLTWQSRIVPSDRANFHSGGVVRLKRPDLRMTLVGNVASATGIPNLTAACGAFA